MLSICCNCSPSILRKIGEKMGEQLRRLREVKPEDPNHFGRINGRQYPNLKALWWPPGPDFRNWGPFDYEGLVDRMIHNGRVNHAFVGSVYDATKGEFIGAALRIVRSKLIDDAEPADRVPVLSYINLDDANVEVILNENGDIIDIGEVILSDWESLCWMPPWYEVGVLMRKVEMMESGHFTSGIMKVALENMGDYDQDLALDFKHGMSCDAIPYLCP